MPSKNSPLIALILTVLLAAVLAGMAVSFAFKEVCAPHAVVGASALGASMGVLSILLDHKRARMKEFAFEDVTVSNWIYMAYRIVVGAVLGIASAAIAQGYGTAAQASVAVAFLAAYLFDVSRLLSKN